MATPQGRYYQYIRPITQSPIFKNKLVRSYSPFVFSLITIAVLIVFAIRPTLSTILNLQKDVQNHQETLQKLKDKSQNITLAKQNLEQIDQTTQTKISNSVPDHAAVASIVSTLKDSIDKEASAGSVIQIQPVSLTPTENSKLPTLESVNFTFNAEGNFELFLSVLDNIKVGERSISINAITISKQADGPTIMSLNGKGYYLK